jgi:hypothetical protein
MEVYEDREERGTPSFLMSHSHLMLCLDRLAETLNVWMDDRLLARDMSYQAVTATLLSEVSVAKSALVMAGKEAEAGRKTFLGRVEAEVVDRQYVIVLFICLIITIYCFVLFNVVLCYVTL